MSFDKDNFLVIKKAIEPKVAEFIYNYFLMKRQVARTFFDTKYDYNDTLEDINLCSINVIVLTLLIVYFVKYNNSQDI